MCDYKDIQPFIEIKLRVFNIRNNEALLFVDKLRGILGSCVKQIYPVGAVRRKEKTIISIDMLLEVPDDQRQSLSERIDYLLGINFFISTLIDTPEHKQYLLENKCLCNLYIMSTPYLWGLQYFILTGPASFVEKVLNSHIKSPITDELLDRIVLAYQQAKDKIILTRLENELELFELLGLNYIEPQYR